MTITYLVPLGQSPRRPPPTDVQPQEWRALTIELGRTKTRLSPAAVATLQDLARHMIPGGPPLALDTVSPGGLVYNSSRIGAYTNTELVALLSRESLTRNVSRDHGMVDLGATARRPAQRPSARDSDSAQRVVRIPITPVAELSYPEAVVEELVGRRVSFEMLHAFDTTGDMIQLSWLQETLGRIRGAEVDSALSVIAAAPDTIDPRTVEERTYLR
jgi:hypothetical protein